MNAQTFFESIAIPLAKDNGWKIAPCFPHDATGEYNGQKIDGKTVHMKLCPKPLEMSSSSLEQIHKWAKREPNANVCVYARQEKGGLCFLDKDGAHDLRAAYEKETGKEFPKTLLVRSSRRNGTERGHFYFTQTPRTITFKKNISEDATDGWFSFRVKNEYVCTIGSIHPETKEPYTVVEDNPILPMPDDLLDWLQDQANHKPKTRKEAAARGRLKKGQRYNALISEVGRLWKAGWSRDLTIDAGIKWAQENFELPEGSFDADLVRSEIEHLIDSYPQGEVDNEDPTDKIAAVVEALNKRFYVVENFGGKCRVCEEVEEWHEGQQHVALVHQSFTDFANRFMHERIKFGVNKKGETVYQSKSRIWLGCWQRRQYQRVVYLPETPTPKDVRNLWRGFAYQPVKGDCSKYVAHIKDNICQGKQERYDWIMRWFAYSVRHPAEPGHTCPVFKGGQGVGKNIAAESFARLWGAHALTITQKSHFTGNFNAHLRNCSVLIVNEAFFAGDRSQAGAMKGLVTDRTIAIEAKGVDVVMTPNLLHIIFCSNEDWVVPADLDVRRFTVFEVSDAQRENLNYFAAINKELQNGGYSALLYHLLHEVELGNFSPRLHLPTEELDQQKEASLTGMESVWYECLQRGQLPANKENMGEGEYRFIGAMNAGDGGVLIRGGNLVDWAAHQHRYGWNNVRTEHVGHLLGDNPRAVKPGMGFTKQKVGGVNHWLIPSLKEARETWNKKRFEEDWKTGEEDEEDWSIGE
jgi:hypothetical protein